ncbi:hypothetical protein Tco_0307430, partial [Tanacetum coccineum]
FPGSIHIRGGSSSATPVAYDLEMLINSLSVEMRHKHKGDASRRDLSSDGVRELTTTSQEFLYSGWRRRHQHNVTPSQRRSRRRHDENPIHTLGDYSKPSHKGYRNTIELPEGNNVVPLRSDTIRLVQNGCLFHRLRSEDPNQHLKDFLKLVDSLNLDGDNRIHHYKGGSYYPIPCSILSTRKNRKTPQRYPDVPTTSWRIFI